MIDMTLLPEPWRSEYVAVCSVSEGESMHRRLTLRLGDLLLQRNRFRQINADGSATSMTVYPRPPVAFLVGRDVYEEQLYPDLWADWSWA